MPADNDRERASELLIQVDGKGAILSTERRPGPQLEPEDALRLAAGEAIALLRAHMAKDVRTKDDRQDASLFAAVVSSWTRDKASSGAGRALDYQMARDLAENKEELKRYVRITQPTHRLVPALGK